MGLEWSLRGVAAVATALGVLLAFWQYQHGLPERRLRLLLELRDSKKSNPRVQAVTAMLVVRHFRRVFYPDRPRISLWWNMGTIGVGALLVGTSLTLLLARPEPIFGATSAFGAALIWAGYKGAESAYKLPVNKADLIRQELRKEEDALLAEALLEEEGKQAHR